MALAVARKKYDFDFAHLAAVIAVAGFAEGRVEFDALDHFEPAHLVKPAPANYSEDCPRHPSPLSCRSAYNCPHAAEISSPRLSRIVAVKLPLCRIAWKRSTVGRELARKGEAAKGLKKIKLTFARNGPSIFANRRASSAESFIPSSITYSNIIRRRRASGRRLHAS